MKPSTGLSQAVIAHSAEPAPVRLSRAVGRLAIEPLGHRAVSLENGPLRRVVDTALEDDLGRKEAAEKLRRTRHLDVIARGDIIRHVLWRPMTSRCSATRSSV
jgi:hypothetical protein